MNDNDRRRQLIRDRRRALGLNQAQLAELMGRSESWLYKIESGDRPLDRISVLERLGEILGVDLVNLPDERVSQETVDRAREIFRPLLETHIDIDTTKPPGPWRH